MKKRLQSHTNSLRYLEILRHVDTQLLRLYISIYTLQSRIQAL